MMKADVNQGIQKQKEVNTYFQTRVVKWNTIYTSEKLRGEIYRARQTTALDWIDNLALKPGSHVLEVGCGAGFLSIALAQRGFHVEAIDSVEGMVETARQHAQEAQVAKHLAIGTGDVNALTFEKQTFDLVVALGVIPWIEKPEAALREIARVTKPGGYVLLTTDNLTGLTNFCDPVHNPLSRPVKQALNKLLRSFGSAYRIPVVTSQSCQRVDKMLARVQLDKLRGRTLGFGPFTFFNHVIIPNDLGERLHTRLQCLADQHRPWFRSSGRQYIVLTRKSK